MRLHKDAKVEMLRRVPLFKECTKQQLQSIASVADELDWPQGRPIARQGDSRREFIVIVEGTTDVTIGAKKVGALGAGDRGPLNPAGLQANGWNGTSPRRTACRDPTAAAR